MKDSNRPADDATVQVDESTGTPTTSALFLAALGHLRAGRAGDAEACCREALALDSEHADALHLMGLLALQVEQYGQATDWIARAIQREPKPIYLTSLGTCLSRQDRGEEALQVFDKAVQLKPDDANLWRDLANALVALERTDEAVLSLQHALKLNPQHWETANQCAVLLHGLGRVEESLSYLDLCDALRPNDVATLQRQAACLSNLKRFEDALSLCHRSHTLAPHDAAICNNLGTVLRSLGRDEDALPWLDRALSLQPGFRDALHNRAAALAKIRKLSEAMAVYEQLRTDDPTDALAELGIAHLQLLTGNFGAGWAGREARWKMRRNYPQFAQPVWLGRQSLAGKTILVASDEGLGDTLQFVRYVPMLAERGARVVLVVQDPLYPLLSKLPGISQCLPMSATRLPPFDFHCPLMSLPLAFGTTLQTIPASIPYLPAPDDDRVQAWQRRLGTHDRLRVGLCWAGNPGQPDDHNRSIALRTFLQLFDADAVFISVQKETKPEDQAALREMTGMIDMTGHLTDFAETAALLSCLDLVISVETSVAHLAGALGRPTWTLLCYTPDHRWLLDRDDSPWYPSMRLFRQDSPGDWQGVFDRVRRALEKEIASLQADVAFIPE
ncbi:tetratricopeptide repeat-containing glycosyltransferase family protein [Bradyrhizobium sp. Tv2a-2]|uniref:tetratricopeptide repeat-containing glycosyltransferase family protein n=1 Tax=Bradyrhizobium sp. Tv2a-2 TaxID=113395 RepID=UPI00041A0102|nr:tetratricopeptide repeat-containing glycosyltransferase family protein [Bradyrhizobium sp. Tv2a-2]